MLKHLFKSFCLSFSVHAVLLVLFCLYLLQYNLFEENLHIYFDLEQFLIVKPPTVNNGPIELNVCGENECRRLHCSLRDLSSLLQGIGRLVEHMCGEYFETRKLDAQNTLEK